MEATRDATFLTLKEDHKSGKLVEKVEEGEAMKESYSMKLDVDNRRKAAAVYERYGISLASAVNAFLAKSVEVGGFPFAVNNPRIDFSKLNVVEGPIMLSAEEFYDEEEDVYDEL